MSQHKYNLEMCSELPPLKIYLWFPIKLKCPYLPMPSKDTGMFLGLLFMEDSCVCDQGGVGPKANRLVSFLAPCILSGETKIPAECSSQQKS